MKTHGILVVLTFATGLLSTSPTLWVSRFEGNRTEWKKCHATLRLGRSDQLNAKRDRKLVVDFNHRRDENAELLSA